MTDEPKKKIGRPRSPDPAVTVSFSMPRSVAEEVNRAIARSDAPSKSAWFLDAALRKMGRPSPNGRADVTPLFKKGGR